MLIVITGSDENQIIRERKLSDADWNETILDIARGEWTDVSQVIGAATGIDYLPTLAIEVSRIWAERNEPLADWQKDFLQANGVTGKQRLPKENILEIDLAEYAVPRPRQVVFP